MRFSCQQHSSETRGSKFGDRMQLHSTETVVIKKKKGEGKCNLARFDVNSVLRFIMRNNLGLQ